MADLRTHRDEKETFSITFELDAGESLTGTPTVSIGRRHATIADQWDDVSAEFGITAIAISGADKVVFTKAVASGADQRAGDDYAVRVKADTDASRSPVEAPTLEVLATASV